MKDLKGYIMIIVAAIFWGTSATAAKSFLNQQLDTVLLVQSRVTFTFLLMLGFYLVFKPQVLLVQTRDLWRLAMLGVIGVAGSNFTYYVTIKESTVATGILLQYTAPLLVMTYGAVTREETFTVAKLTAAVVSLLGCFLAVGGFDFTALKITPIGMVSGLGSIFCFAFLNIFTRHLLARYAVWTVLFYSIAAASAFWLVINPPWKILAESPSPVMWRGLLILAVVSVLIPHSLYFNGLRYVVASRAIITSTLEPVVAIVSAALVLGEYLGPLQIVGAVFVIVAILMLQISRETFTSDGFVAAERVDAA
jgi:drug/metabolite transporter (DMT)-like permease